ncbi:hypothetical protein AB0M20_28000 [Actinoplanes sp. NPDC051633]|uniref:hypothetical protein n=1 Tax=Actinoplanes sp. NPDC051633 TaxID=3155670 RepID=UPI00343AEFDF
MGWEFPFYGGVLEADGLLLIGGARATRIAGIIALNQKTPVLPVVLFGGAAEEIWNKLRAVGNDTDSALRSAMAETWSATSAKRLVAALDEQRKRRARRLKDEARAAEKHQRQLALRHLAGLALVAAAVAAGSVYYGWPLTGVVAIAMLAAAGGALVSRQNVWRIGRRVRAEAADVPAAITVTRGAFAGLITVLTYVVSQTLGSGPSDQLANGSITVFALAAGAVAGFTADRVLARIRPVEVGNLNRGAGPAAQPAPAAQEE